MQQWLQWLGAWCHQTRHAFLARQQRHRSSCCGFSVCGKHLFNAGAATAPQVQGLSELHDFKSTMKSILTPPKEVSKADYLRTSFMVTSCHMRQHYSTMKAVRCLLLHRDCH